MVFTSVADVLVPVWFRDDDLRACDQRPEDLQHRHVERHRSLLKDSVDWAERVGLLHPQQPVTDAPVGVERALRRTGGSGRVDDVRDIGRRRPGRRRHRVPLQRGGHIEAQEFAGEPFDAIGVALVRDAHRHTPAHRPSTVAMRLLGCVGSIGMHAPPALRAASIATTRSSERSRITGTIVSHPRPWSATGGPALLLAGRVPRRSSRGPRRSPRPQSGCGGPSPR